MIHPHDKRKHNRLGIALLAEIHSPPYSTPQALGTTAGYSLHRKATDTAAWSEAFPIASIGNLLSCDELQITIALRTGVNRISKARNAAVGSLLTGWGFMAFPALRMRAASPDI